jgi:Family of unknown function (DUF6496)
MHKRKRGTLKSGSGRKLKSRKQAIAIGLSESTLSPLSSRTYIRKRNNVFEIVAASA